MKSRLLHSALKTSDLRGKSLLSAKRGFNSYLNYLKTNSIASNSVVKQIENTMYSYLNKGINPVVFYDENGVFIEKDIILYKNFQGLGVNPVAAAQLAKEASKAMHKIIDKMMDIPFMDKTFGAVFANGFNLSCWNSTFTPAKVQTELSKIQIPFFKKAFNNMADSADKKLKNKYISELNFLLKAVDICFDMYTKKLPNGANWRSCSREAINIYVDFMTSIKAALDYFVDQIESVRGVTISQKTVPSTYTFLGSYINNGGQPFTWSEKQHGNATYRIINVPIGITLFEKAEGTLSDDPNLGDSNNDPDNNNNGNTMTAPNNISQAGFGLIPTLLLGGLLLGGYKAFANKSKN